MVKKLANIAFFLASLSMQTYAQPHKAQQATKSDKPAAPIVPVSQKQPDSTPLQPTHEEHVPTDVWIVHAPAKDGYDYAAFWVSVALLGVGIFGVIYAKGTLDKLAHHATQFERLAKSADDNASAALLSAQAVINAERPWLLVIIEPVLGPMGGFNVRIQNRGRTPAIVLGAHIGCAAVENIEKLPSVAPYGAGSPVRDRIVIQGETVWVTWFDSKMFKQLLGDSVFMLAGENQIVVFGKIIYHDLLGRDTTPHETRWIGLYEPPHGDEGGNSIFRVEGVGVSDEYDRHS